MRATVWYCCQCGDGPNNGNPYATTNNHNFPEPHHRRTRSSLTCDSVLEHPDGPSYDARKFSFGPIASTAAAMGGIAVGACAALDAVGMLEDWIWYSAPSLPLSPHVLIAEPWALYQYGMNLEFGDSSVAGLENPRGSSAHDNTGHGLYRTLGDTIIFGTAVTCAYHLNRNDKFQDSFLFAGVASGVIIGLATNHSLYDTVLGVLPWAVLSSLVASSCTSRVLGVIGRRRAERSSQQCQAEKCPGCGSNSTICKEQEA